MKKILLLFLVCVMACSLTAQDFRCQISINSNQVDGGGSNRNRYNTLQEALYKFINDRKWCTYTFKNQERIECSLMINLTDVAGEKMSATMTVQMQRPVYNTSYKSTVLNFQDREVHFSYEEGQPLEYADNTNLSQLTSIIAFYLNLFMAVDFDSFSMNGGAEYFTKCQNIVNICQSSPEKGWKSAESGQSNRYWLIENFTNGQYSKIHEFLYTYHRLGLDAMSESADAGRSVIAESLRLLQQVASQRSNLYLVRLIVQAKSDEIVNIFKEGLPSEKSQVINIMKQLDPANSSKYEAINTAQQ